MRRGEFFKVVAVTEADGPLRQYVLRLGDVLAAGRAADSDIRLVSRAASARHFELFLQEQEVSPGHRQLRLFIKDCSVNGTAISVQGGSVDGRLHQLQEGVARLLPAHATLLVPSRPSQATAEGGDEQVRVVIRQLGDMLPDPLDHRSGRGRWLYKGKLGEGVLGVVYGAEDMTRRLGIADVAIKVVKPLPDFKAAAQKRHAYILHREAQWSICWLHNRSCPKFDEAKAQYFVKYLEDHTGKWASGLDIVLELELFQSADFDWEGFVPPAPLPESPYVVLEFVHGCTVNVAMAFHAGAAAAGLKPSLGGEERREVARQAAEALAYLSSFSLIHRDFRTSNLMWTGGGGAVGQQPPPGRLRVIDLGHMITADATNRRSRSVVVKCNWRETASKKFDWAPDEVKLGDVDVNFEAPAQSFDVYSLGVLIVQLDCADLKAARHKIATLKLPRDAAAKVSGALGVPPAVLKKMLGEAAARPRPTEIARLLAAKALPTARAEAPRRCGGSPRRGGSLRSRSPRGGSPRARRRRGAAKDNNEVRILQELHTVSENTAFFDEEDDAVECTAEVAGDHLLENGIVYRTPEDDPPEDYQALLPPGTSSLYQELPEATPHGATGGVSREELLFQGGELPPSLGAWTPPPGQQLATRSWNSPEVPFLREHGLDEDGFERHSYEGFAGPGAFAIQGMGLIPRTPLDPDLEMLTPPGTP
eukprot:TRINITY_DN26914_c0_g1_i1.p1 TRINITY_DN26914_c0_g1~~TRINITY_DN26914_c0_g1_i1.p1  ORF type:complete len:705 (-),score=177.71 TRINITY_DN26914_c0_g1_i1:845-2959(-)